MKAIKYVNCAKEGRVIRFEKAGGEILYQLDEKTIDSNYFLVFDCVNHNSFDARLEIHFYSKKVKESPSFSVIIAILPQIKAPIVIPLSYLDGQSMNGVARPGILCTAIDGTRLAVEDISFIGIASSPCHVQPLLEISAVCIEKSEPSTTFSAEQLEELIDEFGQYKKEDWPHKTHSLGELKNYLEGELHKARIFISEQEESFFGKGDSQHESTGFYRIGNQGDRKILITPDGKEFFSFGCDCVGASITGPLGEEKSHDYLFKNIEKVWADKAYENWSILTRYRLLKWGMNTIGAWSDSRFIKRSKFPYTTILDKAYPTTVHKIYRDFPDVFSKEYQENARAYAKSLEPYKADPYLIGYFMTNEPQWAFVRELNLGYECLTAPSSIQSKHRLIAWLKEKFESIEVLNQIFETNFKTFEELEKFEETTHQTSLSEQALEVLDQFTPILIREFVRLPAEALREIDPHHLNLGLRYAFISSEYLFAGSEFLDVFSINCYDISAEESIERIYAHTKLPVIIGEFTFGALDRGLPATCIQGVEAQADRGKAIRDYVEGAKRTGHCLGVHHFQLNDEPYLGRFDGENYNIGLVDVCNREYEEVTEILSPVKHIPAIYF